jgi:RimJ/RimL family protein N-acetyltransferase
MTAGPRLPAPLLLADRHRVTVRRIEVADASGLRAMHRRLSPTSVLRRFFAPLPELSDERAAHFCDVDGIERVALVAVNATGDLVGVARYDRLPCTADAEVAIVVQDDHQHLGLGTALLRLLVEYAHAHGVLRFTADVLSDNARMFAAFRDAGLVGAPTYDHGVAHVLLPLPRTPAAVSTAAATGSAGLPTDGESAHFARHIPRRADTAQAGVVRMPRAFCAEPVARA